MAQTNEPRALSAALAGPAFAPRAGGLASHAAERHVEKWAPETAAGNSRVRSMRSLGFVDRLISPWVETAQRSASLRMFSQYRSSGMPEGEGREVSWVFPRPWYQDELDWMAASRRAPLEQSAASLFTTRGTYVPPAQQQRMNQAQTNASLSPALYEYVAPSLSIAAPTATPEIGYGGDVTLSRRVRPEAFSTLIPLAAVQAAEVMSRTVSRLPTTIGSAPALRSVLSTLLERTTQTSVGPESPVTRSAAFAPELETPPAPRDDRGDGGRGPDDRIEAVRLAQQTIAQQASPAGRVAESYAQQHAQLAEVQRVARQSVERAAIERVAIEQQRAAVQAASANASTPSAPSPSPAPSSEQQARMIEAAQRVQQDAQQQIEERVARRVAERQASRLHETSRTEAAAHARAAVLEPIAPAVASVPAPVAVRAPMQAPPELAAAMSSLPPELAAMLAQRPDRAMQTIAELDQAYRTVELLARNAAAGGSFEVTRGPRLMMPAGLGGLVAAVEQAPFAAQPMMSTMSSTMSSMAAPSLTAARASDARVRMPAWVAAARPEMHSVPSRSFGSTVGAAPRGFAPTSALGATAAAMPAALGHVAWSDRWLARFAGASAQSLDTLSVGTHQLHAPTGREMPRILGLSSNAPDSVFVSPMFDAVRDGERVRVDARGHVVVTPPLFAPSQPQTSIAPSIASSIASSIAPTSSVAGSADSVLRFDDADETPDDVFAAISASASQRRAMPAMPMVVPDAPRLTPAMARTGEIERPSIADSIAHSAPMAPTAGLAAHLAASPFAPALRHVLSIPSANPFDVRALFGSALSSTFLAGLLEPEAHEIEVATRSLPSWAMWGAPETGIGGAAGTIGTMPERAVPEWDAAYVAPDVERFETEAGLVEARTILQQPSAAAIAAATTAPFTTVRSALLSWEGELPTVAAAASAAAAMSAPGSIGELGGWSGRALGPSTARDMIEAMTMPLLGDVEMPRTGDSWAAPGMVAERAHSWSVASERSSADLAFDFVPPELVLAARVYGLGPAEAAQAARLAIVGPGPLSAMASTVDRTFVQAMAFEADRRERIQRGESPASMAMPTSAPAISASAATTAAAIQAAYPTTSGEVAAIAREVATSTSAPTSFGVERRAPRGAFLWPQATVAALKLDAPSPDSQQSMSIAALELLAAQTVAELGTYASLGEGPDAITATMTAMGSTSTTSMSDAGTLAARAPDLMGSVVAPVGRPEAVEPDEQDVWQAAIALVPESRRARFDALYIALGKSPSSVGVSPAARAARALALAGRGEDAPTSARERAAAAWDVLPVVYAVELGEAAAASYGHETSGGAALTGGARERAVARAGARDYVAAGGSRELVSSDPRFVDVRPGLGNLSARAGEALGSYIAPSLPSSASASAAAAASSSGVSSGFSPADREMVGALLRAPTAAQEMVQTGRPSGRFGGGEVEIPTWFEAAARKMFESQQSSMGGDISLAELTLISSAPSNQLAASTRGTPGAASPLGPSAGGRSEAKPGQQIDIEKIANEVYRQILAMMDAARARNGEPYL